MRRHTRAQTQFSCRRTMRPFSIRTERGTSSCQLQCPQENAHSLSAERLPLTASTTSFCLVIAMHAHSPLLSRSSRNEEVVVGCCFFLPVRRGVCQCNSRSVGHTGSAAYIYRNDCTSHAVALTPCCSNYGVALLHPFSKY